MMMNKAPGLAEWDAPGNPWEFAQYALRNNRLALINRFNGLVGKPSYAISVMQEEFVEDRMDFSEMIALVREYSFIIAAARRADPGAEDTV